MSKEEIKLPLIEPRIWDLYWYLLPKSKLKCKITYLDVIQIKKNKNYTDKCYQYSTCSVFKDSMLFQRQSKVDSLYRLKEFYLLKMVYSIAERVEIVMLYAKNGDCARATARLFNQNHPNKSMDHSYVSKLVRKFMETGSVQNKTHTPARPIVTEENEIGILGEVAANHTQSLRCLESTTGLSKTSILRILKKYKLHPYKPKLVQELNEDDPDRRAEFCEIMSQKLIDQPRLLSHICFSDECTFFLNGNVNKHNVRYWSDENPHWFREHHTQKPGKLNVWAGILGNRLVGPFFLEGNLTGPNYLELLETCVDPQITEILENDHLDENLITFQQDGAPPHFAKRVRDYLDERFPGRWIGRRGSIEWPARSPDLTPLDFFLWGHLKSKIYATKPLDLADLRRRIVEECRLLTPEVLENVRDSFHNRLYLCMEVNGGHFQQFL